MSGSERRKGVGGEREVRELLARHGFEVRGLEAGGDHLALGHGLVLAVECKRQEVARPWAWWEQSIRDGLDGTLPLVVFRRSRSPWLVLADADRLLAELAR